MRLHRSLYHSVHLTRDRGVPLQGYSNGVGGHYAADMVAEELETGYAPGIQSGDEDAVYWPSVEPFTRSGTDYSVILPIANGPSGGDPGGVAAGVAAGAAAAADEAAQALEVVADAVPVGWRRYAVFAQTPLLIYVALSRDTPGWLRLLAVGVAAATLNDPGGMLDTWRSSGRRVAGYRAYRGYRR